MYVLSESMKEYYMTDFFFEELSSNAQAMVGEGQAIHFSVEKSYSSVR